MQQLEQDSICEHVKVYDEELLQSKQILQWTCLKCHTMGASDDIRKVIYKYDQIIDEDNT